MLTWIITQDEEFSRVLIRNEFAVNVKWGDKHDTKGNIQFTI